MILGQEEKPSLTELAHHGVKGMKWGVRHAPSYRDGRRAQSRIVEQTESIRDQKHVVKNSTGAKRTREEAKLGKMKKDFLNNPDRVTAARISKGELAAVGILTVATGGIGLVPAGAVIGVRQVAAHRIAKKQRTGAYGK